MSALHLQMNSRTYFPESGSDDCLTRVTASVNSQMVEIDYFFSPEHKAVIEKCLKEVGVFFLKNENHVTVIEFSKIKVSLDALRSSNLVTEKFHNCIVENFPNRKQSTGHLSSLRELDRVSQLEARLEILTASPLLFTTNVLFEMDRIQQQLARHKITATAAN